MGEYLSFSFQVSTPGLAPRVLEAAFGHPFVTPAAVGGVADGGDYFLAGWALEDFLPRFQERTGRPPRSIEVAAEGPGAERDYLERLAAAMRRLESTGHAFAPHETVDAETGVTYLSSPPLARAALDRAADWSSHVSHPLFYGYVAVALSVRQPVSRPWREAFRGLFDFPPHLKAAPVAYPLLLVSAETPARSPDVTEVRLFSEAHVWLRDGGSLSGQVGPDEADQNLAALADLAGMLCTAAGAPLREPMLRVDGRAFLGEAQRLREAFADIAGLDREVTW
jgi:hypothetical protein